jgi:tetratricopeptide (TPR) repeat protein/transcriptional regulator with XRE-family HTH domain
MAVGLHVRLRAWRREARLSQEEVAERCGLAARTVRNLELGRNRPRRSTVELLIDGLGLGEEDAAWLRSAADADADDGGLVDDARSRWLVPHQLPAEVRHFAGRRAELRWLDEAAAVGVPPLLLICGAGGVGKTALAVQWAHSRADRYVDGAMYVDLRGYGQYKPAGRAEVLARLLVQVGHEPAGATVDDLVAQWRTATADRAMLLLLDNAASAVQVRSLLPASEGSCVIVTCRDDLAGLVARDGAVRLDVDVLQLADSTDLLRSLIGPAARRDRGAVRRLADACGHLPLALRIAAELATARVGSPLAELADRLGRDPLGGLHSPGDPHSGLRAVLTSSYRGLPRHTRRAFRRLGVHPIPTFDMSAAALLFDAPVLKASHHLEVLVRAHMVDRLDDEHLVMHALVHAFARELSERHPEASKAAFGRLATDLVRASRGAMRASGEMDRGWLTERRPLLLATATAAKRYGRLETVVELAGAIGGPLETVAAYDDAVGLQTQAAKAGESLGRMAEAAEAWRRAGVAQYRLGRLDDATGCHRRALAAYQVAGDRIGEARCLMNLGSVRWRSGGRAEALALYRLALGIQREQGNGAGEADVLCNIGLLYVNAGQPDDGVRIYRDAITLYRRIGERRSESIALGNLGVAYLRLGRFDAAWEAQAASLSLAQAVGDRSSEGIAVHNLGEVSTQLGRDRDARRHFFTALSLAREVGDRIGEGLALDYLGLLHRRRGDFSRAEHLHEQGLRIARETRNRDGQCAAIVNLAGLGVHNGQFTVARRLAAEAAALAGEIDAPDRLAQAYNVMADIDAAGGDLTLTLAHRRRALACARRAQDVPEQARTLLALAKDHEIAGRVRLAARHRRGSARLLSAAMEIAGPPAL